MIGSMIAVRDGKHFNVDLLPAPENDRQKGFFDLTVHLAMLVMAMVFAWYGYDFAAFGFKQKSEMSGINLLYLYVSFPIAGVTWALFLFEKMVADARLILGYPAPKPTEEPS